MRKFLLPISVFVSTPLLIFISVVQFAYISFLAKQNLSSNGFNTGNGIAYAALPSSTNQMYGNIGIEDARVEKVASFFNRYNSPLGNYSQQIVQDADNNKFDYRLIPAITMQESQGCLKIPAGSYNCLGYGITSKKTMRFSSYQEALHTAADALGKYYISKGLNTPEQIGPLWNPNNTNDWIEKINYFLNQF